MSSVKDYGLLTGQRSALLSQRMQGRPAALVPVLPSPPPSPRDAKSDSPYVHLPASDLLSPSASASGVRGASDSKALVPFVSPKLSLDGLVKLSQQLCSSERGRQFFNSLVRYCLVAGLCDDLTGPAAGLDALLGHSWRSQCRALGTSFYPESYLTVAVNTVPNWYANDAFNTVGSAVNCNQLCQIGAIPTIPTNTTRQSNRVHFSYVDIAGMLYRADNPNAGINPTVAVSPLRAIRVRMMVVIDKMAIISTPAAAGGFNRLTNLIDNTNVAVFPSNDEAILWMPAAPPASVFYGIVAIQSPLTAGVRFDIAYDEVFTLNSMPVATDGVAYHEVSGGSVRFRRKIPLDFVSSYLTSTSSLPWDNGAYLLIWTDVDNTDASTANLVATCVTHFRDVGGMA